MSVTPFQLNVPSDRPSRDWVSLDGKVHDPSRIDFTARHLLELSRALADGVPIEAYFHWSFIDNFEWARRHWAIIRRFGRFPHRNAVLGRASTPEETEFLKQPGSGF